MLLDHFAIYLNFVRGFSRNIYFPLSSTVADGTGAMPPAMPPCPASHLLPLEVKEAATTPWTPPAPFFPFFPAPVPPSALARDAAELELSSAAEVSSPEAAPHGLKTTARSAASFAPYPPEESSREARRGRVRPRHRPPRPPAARIEFRRFRSPRHRRAPTSTRVSFSPSLAPFWPSPASPPPLLAAVDHVVAAGVTAP